jgi:hypothetical protein
MTETLSLVNVTMSQVICLTILVMLVLHQHCFCGEFSQLGDKKQVGKSNNGFFGNFFKIAIA